MSKNKIAYLKLTVLGFFIGLLLLLIGMISELFQSIDNYNTLPSTITMIGASLMVVSIVASALKD